MAWAALVALVAAAGCGAAPSGVPAAGAAARQVEREEAIVRDLYGPNARDAYAGFHPAFRKKIPFEHLQKITAAATGSLGALREAKLLSRVREGDGSNATVAAIHERGAMTYTIKLDREGALRLLEARPIGGREVTEGAPGPADGYVARRAYGLPGRGAWFVVHGGRAKRTNHHVGNRQQWYAYDLLVVGPDRRSSTGAGKANADHHAFGQPVIAPAEGTVVTVVDGVPDNPPGIKDGYFVPGNLVVVDHGDGEHSFLAHFQRGSIVVRVGDRVEKGQVLGKVGNSGNTSQPHIHWHLGTSPNMHEGHGLPVRFAPLTINGARVEGGDPQRGDLLEEAP